MTSPFFVVSLELLFFIPSLLSGDPPKTLSLSVGSEGVGQGKTIAIYLSSSSPLQNVEGIFSERTFPFFLIKKRGAGPPLKPVKGLSEKDSGPPYTYRALLGIPIETKTGSYLLRINFDPAVDSLLESRIEVVETPFEREVVTIPPSKENLLTSGALEKEAEIIGKVLENRRSHQYWTGRFLIPIEGRISSPFGIYRAYNDGTTSRPHRGVDIANMEGTPILSPNSGKVVLSRHFEFHGNTLIIDHGQGVYSILNHLKRRYVQKGDRVKKGETIGLVGETGLATGPHLHWGFSVSTIRVDALEWTEKEF